MNLVVGSIACLLGACDIQHPLEAPGAAAPSQTPSEIGHRRHAVLEISNSPAGGEVARRMLQREDPEILDPSMEPAALMVEFASAEPLRREEIITLLGASGAAEAWSFLCHQAGAADQGIRLAALNALAMHNGGDPSQAIAEGLNFPDEETRALAATLLGRRVHDIEVWAQAATDASPVVRIAYLAAVEEAPASIRLAAARAAMATGDQQLRVEAASVLGGIRNKQSAGLLISLLDDPAAGTLAADGIFYLFGRGFGSSAEAQAWWSKEAASYSADLQPASK